MSGGAASMRWDRRALCLATVAAALCALTAATHLLHWRLGGFVLMAAFAAGTAAALAAPRLAAGVDRRLALAIVLVGGAAMRLALLWTEPTLSSDIYRYIWDGRVQAAGINPYAHVPAAAELAALRDPDIWPHINRADYAVTLYPPLAQVVFLAVTRLGESVAVMKLALLLLEAGGIAAIVALLRRIGKPATDVAAYAWHPLPVWEIAGNGHLDAAMLAFLLAGLLVYVRGRTLAGGVLVTLGALVKPLAILALPVLWRPRDWRLPLCVLATVALAYLPYLSVGWGVLGFAAGYAEEKGLVSGQAYKPLWLLQQATGPLPYATPVYLAAAALALGTLALAVGFRSDRSPQASLRAAGWLLTAFLVLVSPNYPWYFLVLVPFLALAPSATAWVMTGAGVLFYNVVPGDILPAYEVRIALFTLAVLAALAFDLWGELRARRTASPAAIGGTA